jgi:hypothetical protein
MAQSLKSQENDFERDSKEFKVGSVQKKKKRFSYHRKIYNPQII